MVDRDEAFTAFVRVHRTRLLRAAYLVSGDATRAEDVTQIALSKLYLAWFRVNGAHESYVRTIIARTAADEARRPWRREIPGEVDERLLPSRSDDTAALLARVTLRTALLTLPVRQRQVVVLRLLGRVGRGDGRDAGPVVGHGEKPRLEGAQAAQCAARARGGW